MTGRTDRLGSFERGGKGCVLIKIQNFQPVLKDNTETIFSAQKNKTHNEEEYFGCSGKAKLLPFIRRSIWETASSRYEGRHIYDGLGYLRLRLKDGVTKVVSDC